MSTTSKAPPVIVTEAATFIGIDYHKKYSIRIQHAGACYHVMARGNLPPGAFDHAEKKRRHRGDAALT